METLRFDLLLVKRALMVALLPEVIRADALYAEQRVLFLLLSISS